jgi:hypothetical protein
MSTYRNQLERLAFAVHEAVLAYAAVHQYITQHGATFKSVIKKIVGRGIPLSQLLEAAEALIPIWEDVSERASNFGHEAYHLMDDDEQRYFNILTRYIAAINEAVSALVARQRILVNHPVHWTVFQAAETTYDAAARRHVAMEQELNDARPWK